MEKSKKVKIGVGILAIIIVIVGILLSTHIKETDIQNQRNVWFDIRKFKRKNIKRRFY